MLKQPAECYMEFEYDFARHCERKEEFSVSTPQHGDAKFGPRELHVRQLLVIMIIIIIIIIIVMTENKNAQNIDKE